VRHGAGSERCGVCREDMRCVAVVWEGEVWQVGGGAGV